MTVPRRALAKGALWATPVIVTASAAPHISASPASSLRLDPDGFVRTYYSLGSHQCSWLFDIGFSIAPTTLSTTLANVTVYVYASVPGINFADDQADFGTPVMTGGSTITDPAAPGVTLYPYTITASSIPAQDGTTYLFASAEADFANGQCSASDTIWFKVVASAVVNGALTTAMSPAVSYTSPSSGQPTQRVSPTAKTGPSSSKDGVVVRTGLVGGSS